MCYSEFAVHEMAVTREMLDLVLEEGRKGGAHQIKSVNIVLGELSGVAGECVQTYFDLMSRGTMAEGATVSFRIVAATARCRRCGTRFPTDEVNWLCPECGSADVALVGGGELFVESIEVD